MLLNNIYFEGKTQINSIILKFIYLPVKVVSLSPLRNSCTLKLIHLDIWLQFKIAAWDGTGSLFFRLWLFALVCSTPSQHSCSPKRKQWSIYLFIFLFIIMRPHQPLSGPQAWCLQAVLITTWDLPWIFTRTKRLTDSIMVVKGQGQRDLSKHSFVLSLVSGGKRPWGGDKTFILLDLVPVTSLTTRFNRSVSGSLSY